MVCVMWLLVSLALIIIFGVVLWCGLRKRLVFMMRMIMGFGLWIRVCFVLRLFCWLLCLLVFIVLMFCFFSRVGLFCFVFVY